MAAATAVNIPSETWKDYFNEISRLHEGWAVTVELLAGESGDQRGMDGLPFQGISYEPAGSQAGDILIEAGDVGTPFQTHLVHRPRAVRAVPTRPGAEMDIEIEAGDGTTALVFLRPRPQLPPSSKS